MPETGEVHEREANVIEWTMRDFFSLPAREGLCFSSPKFPLDGAEWYLCMYPNGEHTEESKGYIVIYLLRISYDSPIQQNLSLGVKTSKNEIAEDKRPIHNYKNATYQHKWPRFMKMSTLLERQSELVPSGHLTLVCRKKNPPSTDAIGGSSTSGALLTNKILEDYKQLFLNQQSCDVVLRVQGREFQAHKLILTARSPVFASLFQNDTKERANAVVDIEDCNPSIFSDFLCFLYCQEVNRLSEENVSSLLAAADKFGVSDLRTKCLEFMKEKFNVHIPDDTVAPRHSETESIQLAAA